MKQYIGFKLNDNEYTIPILKVREIINTPVITRLPQSPPYVKGIMNLRGRITPIVDLKALISEGQTDVGTTKVIVITNERMTFGILVDSITSVINIDESKIEPPEDFMHEHMERIEGVARFDDRLVILLDTDKLVEAGDLGEFGGLGGEEALVEALEAPRAALPEAPPELEVQPQAEQPAPTIAVAKGSASAPKEEAVKAAKEELNKKYSKDEQKTFFINSMVEFVDTLASHDYAQAEMIISKMIKSSESDTGLYKEVGLVTRRLHDSIMEFRHALDPRLKKIADDEVPQAVDNLQFVIEKTEDAANRTMEIVEKYISSMEELSSHIEALKGPKPSVNYLKEFREGMQKDLTGILLAQEYQDITGNMIRKVIDLVNTIETELIGLITSFGVKEEADAAEKKDLHEKVTQDEIDDLLKEFGF